MDRRVGAGALIAGLVALGACRPDTVRLEAQPEVGDRARYRYEIRATITRALDGETPTTSDIATDLIADQRVVALRGSDVEVEVSLRRDGAAERTARVVLDQGGTIRGIELVEGLSGDSFGLSQLGALLPPSAELPAGELGLGDRWSMDDGPISGRSRLAQLGVVDGADVAVVDSTLTQTVDEAVAAGPSAALLRGELRSETRATYDLDGGSIRRSSSRSRGDLVAVIEPPPGVEAAEVRATITYDITVRVRRLG